MTKQLLLELGLEEVPARFMRGAIEQLQNQMTAWLQEARIEFGEVQAYATPRRLSVIVHEVAERQADVQEEVKGPAKKIAMDEQGQWSKAALGFARSQKVEPDQLFIKELNGVEYVHAMKEQLGMETETLLGSALQQLINSLSFPKNMRWGAYDLKFVRPIRWIVAMLDQKVIPFEVANVKAGNVSRGHRFLGSQQLVITDASHYVKQLSEAFVIVDIEERKKRILEQMDDLLQQKQWQIAMNEDLLEEVVFLVEYPTVLYGSFESEFLSIPQEVLITSMREHQRYFPVTDHHGELLPYFITVRNGDAQGLEQVAKGNEKVLRARLSDARFFYEEDQKLPIAEALKRLEKVVYHEKLGTISDKVQRIRKITHQLCSKLELDTVTLGKIDRAAEICKFDLVTQMVYEFPELQGVMGEDYALKAKEHPEVARAVYEHYQPRFSGDQTPASLIGAVVSMADKVDSIVGCFSIGIIPTGSQDPYALRRQAAGIVQILQAHEFRLALSDLIDFAMTVYSDQGLLSREKEAIEQDLYSFFSLRIKNSLAEQARYDVVDAVISSGFDDIPSVIRRGQTIMEQLEQQEFKPIVEAFNRVGKLAEQATSGIEINPSLFREQVEHDLYQKWQELAPEYVRLLTQGEERNAFSLISQLSQPIHDFFDQVMVMTEDEEVKRNRLALLLDLSTNIQRFAHFQKIVL